MDKIETDAKHVLKQLGALSSYLTGLDTRMDRNRCFQLPLDIMREAMAFDVSVLYKILNVVDGKLILEVTRLFDPDGYRADLSEGEKLILDTAEPSGIYINEVKAFNSKKISCINVPNQGCDMVGYVYLPESLGGGYLFGGDFCGQESAIRDYEASVCEVMCNFLSTILLKIEFEHLAVYDSLTGLLNSRAIRSKVERIVSRFRRKSDIPASIVLCDIDHFKSINDTYGHIQGDVVLKEMGDLLSSSMRRHFDVAGRYGGEEFLLIFDETCGISARPIVERIRKAVENHRFTRTDETGNPIEGEHLGITLSFGIAENRGSEGPCDATQWIARADSALYRSKEEGRNRSTLWEDRDQEMMPR